MDIAVEIKNLTFNYYDRSVLENINITIPGEQLTCILGKNGSGKSTLLRLIAGLQSFHNGTIQVLGQNIREMSYTERTKLIGYLPQQHKSVFPFSVKDVVLTGRAGNIKFSPGKDDHRATEKAIDTIGISELSNRPYTELSGGEQQLVMIARILVQNPKVILLDEPFAHLDLDNQTRIISILNKFIQEKMTIIAVMHDPNIAFSIGKYFVFLNNKQAIIKRERLNNIEIQFLQEIYHSELKIISNKEEILILPKIIS